MGWDDVGDELLARAADDQEVRRAVTESGLVGDPVRPGHPRHGEFLELVGRLSEVDQRNRQWFRERVAAYGWPRASEVGRDAAEAAWLLAQHADADPAFQRQCLDLLQALPDGEVDPARLAMLTDRVMLKESGVQRYGTQWIGRDGGWFPQPLEDPDEVENLRRSVGLDTLEENRRRMADFYGEPGTASV